jgi:hypothetical protein
MLARERDRAAKALRRKAAQAGKSVSDLMERLRKVIRPVVKPPRKSLNMGKVRAWNHAFMNFSKVGLETREVQQRTSQKFGYPDTWSPANVRPGDKKPAHDS